VAVAQDSAASALPAAASAAWPGVANAAQAASAVVSNSLFIAVILRLRDGAGRERRPGRLVHAAPGARLSIHRGGSSQNNTVKMMNGSASSSSAVIRLSMPVSSIL